MKKRIIIILSVLFFSCESVIDLDIDSHDPLLVVNGIIDKDIIPSVYAAPSKGAFSGNKIESIKDASVILYENGIELSPMLIDLNPQLIQQSSRYYTTVHNLDSIYFYRYNSNPNPGSTYSIEVSHPDYNTVFGTTRIPSNVDLLNCKMFIDSTTSNLPFSGDYNTCFKVVFNDNPIEKNYYRLVLYNYWGDYDLTSAHMGWQNDISYSEFHTLRLHSNNPSLETTDIAISNPSYSFSGHHAMFDDDLFNGQQKEILFHVEYDIYTNPNYSLEKDEAHGDRLFLKLIVYSEEGYHFFNSVEKRDKHFNAPFGSEAVPIYSNIKNGIGLFAGSNTIFEMIDVQYE